MPDRFETPVPESFSVTVVLSFREAGAGRWSTGSWEVASVVAGEPVAADNRILHADAVQRQQLVSGLALELHRDEAESYYFNIVSDTPRIFVVCSQEDDQRLTPLLVTLSYDEVACYLETDEVVGSVPMPAEIYRWLERFVLEHYVPEKKRKRKRDVWKEPGYGPR